MKLLPRSYYESGDVLWLSRDLLGKMIVSSVDGRLTSAKIVETEAYRAPEDRGSHAFGNKQTARTEVIFGRGGVAYVYLCYGIHHLCNIVCGQVNHAHAILIRAVEPMEGIDTMLMRRQSVKKGFNLTNGPGKWTQAMGIKTKHTGMAYYDTNSPVQIYDFESVESKDIIFGPRVGIAYAQAWAFMPWRFRIRDNKWTSKPEMVTYNWKIS